MSNLRPDLHTDLHWSDYPHARPNACAFYGHVATASGGRFVTTHTKYHGETVYACERFIIDAALELGWTSPAKARDLQRQIEELVREVGQVNRERDQAVAALDAIDTLESAGYAKRRKPTRTKKAEEVEV